MSHRVTPVQQEFLNKVIPYAMLIQEWTIGKVQFRGKIQSPFGIAASVVAADIMVVSGWGSHEISQPEYDGKYSNNLNLLEAQKGYPGKTNTFNGQNYRAYRKWSDFAADYSDHLVWSDLFTDALLSQTVEEQIAYLGAKKLDARVYNGRISAVIDFYSLSEIDLHGKGKNK